MAKKFKKEKWSIETGVFLGGLFIGLGLGLLYGRPDVGVLIGLGIGFLGGAIVHLLKKKK
jgi:hypothetical protein